MIHYCLILSLIFQTACLSSAQQTEDRKAERKLMQRSPAVIKSPSHYEKRQGSKGEYDPKPKIILIDEKAGKYELRWIGYDGKEKVIKYQRNDAIDSLVEASVKKNGEGKFLYKYLIKNLPSSPSYLSGFIVQSFSSDVIPEKMDDTHIGEMDNEIRIFREGRWLDFAPLGEIKPMVNPGSNIEFRLFSPALPGIVGCRISAGEITLKGVGEHMPSELENALPGYEELASGYTIGPVDKLAEMKRPEKAKYLLDSLPKFEEAGWMAAETAKKYEALFKKEDLAGALAEAKKDMEKEVVMPEIFYIIQGLN